MKKYNNYFENIESFKNKFEIVEDLTLQFNEDNNAYKFKKILLFFLDNKVIQEINYKNKKFYISTSVLKNKNLTIEQYFSQINLDVINTNLNLQKNVYHIADDAIIEKKLTEML